MAAKIEPPRIFQSISPNCVLVVTKCRQHSESDKKFIKKKILRLFDEGIIKPSYSSWCSQVLITKDENHKKHMVIDYSQTINCYMHLVACLLPCIDELINKIAKSKYYNTVDLKSHWQWKGLR